MCNFIEVWLHSGYKEVMRVCHSVERVTLRRIKFILKKETYLIPLASQ